MSDKEIMEQFSGMKGQMDELKDLMLKGFATVQQRFEAIDQRFEAIDRRFEAIDQRFEAIDRRFEEMDQRFNDLEQRMTERIDSVEQRMMERQDQFRTEILGEFQKLTDTVDQKFAQQDQKMARHEHEIKIYMEMAVGKRINALFDGYEIERDRTDKLERDKHRLQRQIEDIQVRLAVLEKKETA